MRRIWHHPEFARGFKDMASPSVGIAAWALMMGVATVGYGFSPLEAVLLCNVVFAGSAQMAAMPLMLAGAPLWVIWATAFCVNLRFLVFSAHLRAYLIHLPTVRRLFVGFFSADMSYAMLTQRHPKPPQNAQERRACLAYLSGGLLINVSSWMLFSTLGVLLASQIPTQWGLGFAGILALVGIACSLANTRLRVLAAGVAAAVALATTALPLKLNILAAILAATAVCLVVQRAKPKADLAGEPDGR